MGLEDVVRQMPTAVIVVEAASRRIIHVNDAAREITERQFGGSIPEELAADLQIFHLDGRPYRTEEWPVVRSITTGEKVVDEECFSLLPDGSRMTIRCSSSPIYDADGVIFAGVLVMDDVTEQKRVEDELRYRASLVERMEDAVIATDENLVVTAWNRGAERLYGWTAEEVLGSDARKVSRWDLSDAHRAEAMRTVDESGLSHAEWRRRRKDGMPVHVEAVSLTIRGESDEITGFLGIHRDISGRKRAEEGSRELQLRSETILASISDEFFAVDREWRFDYVNERALVEARRLSGRILTVADLLGVSLWELYPQLVGTTFDHEAHRAMREQAVVELDDWWSPVSERQLEVRMYPSEAGLSIYVHDVTERKRAEELRARGERQQALLADFGLRALVADDLQPLVDDAAELVARTLEVELVSVVEILPDRARMLLRAGVGWKDGLVGHAIAVAGPGSLMGHTMESGDPVFSADLGADRRFETSALLSGENAVSGATVVIAGRDEPFGGLGAFSRQRRSFSEHDLNFMQAVANVLATAVERTQAQEKLQEVRETERRRIARDLHDEALQELTHALSLAEGPLAHALQRVGQQLRGAIYNLRVEEQEDRPLPELLEALVRLHSAMAMDCLVELDLRDGVPTRPLGQPGSELLRIVGEALTNARRHAGAHEIRLRVSGSDARLVVEVSDDGRGFDPHEEPRGRRGSGITGMRERARLLDADLQIASDPQSGTRVRLELPLIDETEHPVSRIRILLVEDHAAVREAIAAMFEREPDFTVIRQAASLEEARGLLDDVDVAVVDLGLPDGYGGDLIKELREVSPQAEALVLSAGLDREEMARAVECGAAAALDKTAHLDEVVTAVRRLRAGETLLPMDEIVELLRSAGRRREREERDRQAVARLSPREREVLQALAEGLDSQGVADRLWITLRTERNHVSSILAKLGVHSQLQALVFALRYGVVEIR